ncbi:UbiA family prenyltransferase [Saccharothrix obliqua]|uniref:UbiA family prenyltransferase n=1 Tax=Saccharothrix obliqua TaxID=2861747 RepID=UPI001C5D16A1|nr:UbiA family prenyltransferase [Saccharothrix obliqua]MBW4718444.1 UbiA family prenyltransferase [Saccharothrix obliqua]
MTTLAAPGRARAYARLAKLDIVDYYLGVLVVWALLPADLRFDGRVLAVAALFLVGEVLVMAAMVALDDVTGFRDGSDRANYGPDAPARKLARKPLLTGALTERQALRFAFAAAVAGGALWLAAVVVAPHRPMWTLVLLVVTFFFALQYSWGVKLSYHGFQEFFLAALGWAVVLAPYGLAVGEVDGAVVVQALLFGLGPLLFGVYSNTNDVEGDRQVGRPTVAALTSPRGNRVFVTAVSAVEIALVLAAPLAGAPWWFPLALLPTAASRLNQLRVGFHRGDVLRARKLGIHTHRITVVALVVVNLL